MTASTKSARPLRTPAPPATPFPASAPLSGAGAPSASLSGVVLLALALLAAAALFRDGLTALWTAWGLVEYSHGPVIPILSGLLFLAHLKDVPPAREPVRDRWPGVALIALSAALALLGMVAGIDDIVAYALIAWIGGLILVGFGWRRGRGFWPSVLHLVFMLPLPGILYWKLSSELQLFSSELGVALIQAAGAPALLDGNIIDLGVHKLYVAEACSGLRYLFPIMSFSYVFATLYRGPTWHKAALLLAAAPLAIAMNTLRIALVGVMVHRFGVAHAEGLSHLLEGWVIFLACIVILIGLARLLAALQGKPSLRAALGLDLSGLTGQAARLRLTRPSAALAAAIMLTGGAAAAWHGAPERRSEIPLRAPLALFPVELGAGENLWRAGPTRPLPAAAKAALGADDYRWATYADSRGGGADLLIAWYADQTAGGIHSPEICIPGGGWEIESIGRVDLSGPLGLPASFPATRAVIRKGVDLQLVYFWFEQPGGRTASDYAAKAALLRDALLLGRTDGALVRAISPIMADEGIERAEARLRRLLRAMLPILPRFVPGA